MLSLNSCVFQDMSPLYLNVAPLHPEMWGPSSVYKFERFNVGLLVL
jgi:hypothetical protein